jgi:hypothetical protein
MNDEQYRIALSVRFQTLDTDALQRIVHSTDYTEIAIGVARELLSARGVDEKVISDWRDPNVASPSVPLMAPKSVQELRSISCRRRVVYLFTLCWCISVLAGGFVDRIIERWYDIPFLTEAILPAVWFFALLSFLIGGVVIWRQPSLILFLRPFDHRTSAVALRKLIMRYLRYYGQVYTLADSTLTGKSSYLPWRDTFLWGLPGKLVSFNRSIDTESDFEALQISVGRRIPRAINWLFSIDKIFKVRASQIWWQRSMQILANSSCLILLDLSRIGTGLSWEIQEIQYYKLDNRVIVVVQRDNASNAARVVEEVWQQDHRPLLFIYNEDGVVEQPEVFRDYIELKMVHSNKT